MLTEGIDIEMRSTSVYSKGAQWCFRSRFVFRISRPCIARCLVFVFFSFFRCFLYFSFLIARCLVFVFFSFFRCFLYFFKLFRTAQ